MYLWTSEMITRAIERAEKECVEMVRNHAKPEDIARRRRGIAKLREWLEKTDKEA